MAEVFIEQLQKIQPELAITEEEKLCVCIAGLIHDIGHVINGHLFNLYVDFCESDSFVEHEIMSIRIFQKMIEKYNLMEDFSQYNLTSDVCSYSATKR